MTIQQFYDEKLAHASYIIVSGQEAAVVDPARDPQPYLEFAQAHNATITTVLETHPHADFVSCHLELIKEHGATTFVNPKMGVDYPARTLDHNETVQVGEVTFKALFTPGHSPDHNTYLLIDEKGKEAAAFTGDSLFIGDVGRPDLRESAGNLTGKRAELAGMMYDTIQNVFKQLPDDVKVYPAHGAGSLCGKNMSDDTESTIGREKQTNWAFKMETKASFVDALLEGQPFVPKYFPYAVEMNRVGAENYEPSVEQVTRLDRNGTLATGYAIVDIREAADYQAGHLPGSFNIPNTEGDRFETWVGSIINPDEEFYLVSDDEDLLENAIRRLAKIGYEQRIKGAVVYDSDRFTEKTESFDFDDFKLHMNQYTIVDLRNANEVADNGLKFDDAMVVSLPELREQHDRIPTDKPIVLHCAGGYRSAVGSSILATLQPDAKVLDMSEHVKTFDEDPVNA